jgi:predicted DNA binding CopG/RHH family protein
MLKTKQGNTQRVDRLLKSKDQRALNLMIDADLLKKFKIKTTTEGITMTQVIIEAIEEYLR